MCGYDERGKLYDRTVQQQGKCSSPLNSFVFKQPAHEQTYYAPSSLVERRFSTPTIQVKTMSLLIQYRASGLTAGTLFHLIILSLIRLFRFLKTSTSPHCAHVYTISTFAVKYDRLPSSCFFVRALCFHDHLNIMFSCPIIQQRDTKSPLNILYIYILSCIENLRSLSPTFVLLRLRVAESRLVRNVCI